MLCLTGDETGVIKLVDIDDRTDQRYVNADDDSGRYSAVVGLLPLKEESEVFALKMDSKIECYRPRYNSQTNAYELHSGGSFLSTVQQPSGICAIFNESRNTADRMLIYNASGNCEYFADPTHTRTDRSGTSELEFSVVGPISTSTSCSRGGVLFGGKENDVKMYDLNRSDSEYSKPVWEAKNVPQDKLHLRVPVWVTAMSFVDQNTATPSAAKFYTGTAYKHLRLYDTVASRQPQISIELSGQYRVTAIQSDGTEHGLYVATTAGDVTLWDMRKQRVVRALKGAAGSVRSISISPDNSSVGFVGLDRFLRVFDKCNDHQLVSAFYLKNRLNSCVLLNKSAYNSSVVPTKNTIDSAPVRSNNTDEDLLEEIDASESEDEDDNADGDSDDDDEEKEEVSGNDDDDDEGNAGEDDEDSMQESEAIQPTKSGPVKRKAVGKEMIKAPSNKKWRR